MTNSESDKAVLARIVSISEILSLTDKILVGVASSSLMVDMFRDTVEPRMYLRRAQAMNLRWAQAQRSAGCMLRPQGEVFRVRPRLQQALVALHV